MTRPQDRKARIRLAAGAGALLASAAAARGGHVPRGEQRIFRAVNGMPDALYPPAWIVMQLGNLGAAPVAAGAAWLTGDRRLAARLLAGGAATWVLSKPVKRVVGRPRPAALLPGVNLRGRDAAGLGYLSGHAGMVVVLAVTALPRLGPAGRVLALGAIPAVGLTRMYVGAHLPLDIAGGAALGLAVEAALTLAIGAERRQVSLGIRGRGVGNRASVPVALAVPPGTRDRAHHGYPGGRGGGACGTRREGADRGSVVAGWP